MTIKEIAIENTASVHGGKYDKLKLDNVLEIPTSGLQTGYKLKMKVHFLMDDGEILTEYSHKQLDQIVELLKNDPKFKLKILPSVDMVGNEYNNKKLYNQRGRTVTNYLTEKGLVKERILTEEYVPSQAPKVADMAKADIKKRRVEFLLTE